MKVLSENADFTLAHDLQNDWLFIRWRGMQQRKSIVAGCKMILAHIKCTGSIKILNDSTQDEDGWGQLVEWLSADFFRQLADNGVQAVAWVLPTNLRARMDVQKVVDTIERPLTDVFTDTESAYSWLTRMPATGQLLVPRAAIRP